MSEQRLDARIELRCTAAQKADLEARASAAGFATLSAYMLDRGLGGRVKKRRSSTLERTLPADTFERVTTLGETLNGQARAIHRGKPFTAEDVFRTALEIGKAAAADPVLAGLLAGQATAEGSAVAPMAAAHYAALTRVGNNLSQIVASPRFKTFGHHARGLQQFTDRWRAMLTVEADRITASRTGGRA